MSLYEARMPSLRDKLADQAVTERTEKEEVKVEKKEAKVKGRRLNK